MIAVRKWLQEIRFNTWVVLNFYLILRKICYMAKNRHAWYKKNYFKLSALNGLN